MIVAAKPTTKDAVKLFHEGAMALAEVEAAGLRVDTAYLDQAIVNVEGRIKDLEARLRGDKVFQKWRRRFGQKTKLGAKEQLGEIIFGEMGFKHPGTETAKGKKRKCDEAAFADVNLPFVKDYFEWTGLTKARTTYLIGLKREVCDGYVHPSFNLHLVITHRSSSDSPNIQNQINRDAVLAEILRRCYIPRKGRILLEVDYSALEFRIAACFWRDKRMIRYIEEDGDPHKDQAADIFKCPVKMVNKGLRQSAKNQFVFPVLYGSYYRKCAEHIWEMIRRENLKVGTDGAQTPVYEWLSKKGITARGACEPKMDPIPGTFEHHMKGVEARFNKKFPGFGSGKDPWWKKYEGRGWFDLLTGFRLRGIYSKNFLMNTPVQGPAFHCLLWSLIEVVKWLKEKKMRSKVIAEIHDSILLDCVPEEMDAVLNKLKHLMTIAVRKHWPWIICPLGIEAESSDTNWFEKRKVEIP